ncbi:MAG: PstS family phosphate ABC transporter substrate-binding protein, partial [Planctomycetes bacterium]|nr:PstS family phosphate ABC transporter substrate-binding protein [Planctomycetota bacterium]
MLRIIVTMLLTVSAFAADPVLIDGSSTVHPLTAAVARAFAAQQPGAVIDTKYSGTSAGIRRLVAGEVHIAGASRPIKAAELEQAAARGIELVELPVAYDGLTVVVNRRNTFIDHLTVAELKRIWEPGSQVATWAQVRAGWPESPIRLFSPGKDSGTFDYFTEVVVGKSRAARTDVATSEDDHKLVQGVVGDENALAYFGWSYFLENEALLRAVPIAGSGAPVSPSERSILDGSYAPLSRTLFLYVARPALEREPVRTFCRYYLEHAPSMTKEVGYIALSSQAYELARKRLDERVVGAPFSTAPSGSDTVAVLSGLVKPAKPAAQKAAETSAVSIKPADGKTADASPRTPRSRSPSPSRARAIPRRSTSCATPAWRSVAAASMSGPRSPISIASS